jgi:hypothetical protein
MAEFTPENGSPVAPRRIPQFARVTERRDSAFTTVTGTLPRLQEGCQPRLRFSSQIYRVAAIDAVFQMRSWESHAKASDLLRKARANGLRHSDQPHTSFSVKLVVAAGACPLTRPFGTRKVHGESRHSEPCDRSERRGSSSMSRRAARPGTGQPPASLILKPRDSSTD